MPKIPVLLITGFLGSGKTSFLSEYLSVKGDKSTALIINELGQIALDQRVLKSSVSYADEQMLYLNSGCVCCNKRLDLVNSLKSLLDSYDKQNQKLGRVIIETTGLANYEATGAYNMKKRNEIITIVDKTEYQKLMAYINHEDPKAFVTVYNVSDMRYQPKL